MKALFYFSKTASYFEEKDFAELEKISTQNNRQLDITGYLCFYQNYFFQYIEGEENSIFELMEKIKKDERHTIIKIMETNNLGFRRFPRWDMKVFSPKVSIELSLEKIIYDHFDIVHRKDDNIHEDIWRPLLWRLIDKLAEFHRPIII